VIGRNIHTDCIISRNHSYLRDGLMKILLEFAQATKCAVQERQYTEAFAGLCELRRVYSGLVTVYPGFDKLLSELDAGLDRLHRTGRTSLMKDYVRSQDFAEVISIGETLSDCIAADRTWQWEKDFDQALEELEQGRRDVRAFA
jgi:hypothetical protein